VFILKDEKRNEKRICEVQMRYITKVDWISTSPSPLECKIFDGIWVDIWKRGKLVESDYSLWNVIATPQVGLQLVSTIKERIL
jgi:hypothetical protein